MQQQNLDIMRQISELSQKYNIPMMDEEEKYRIICEVARGTLGIVYRVEQKQDQKQYAMKVIHLTLQCLEQLQNQIIQSILNHSIVTHKNIIKPENNFFSTNKNNKHIELVQIIEFADNKDLASYLTKNGKLQEKEILSIFKQILKGVRCLHQSNVLHRDIRPQNILLYHNIPKISGFDLSTKLSQINQITNNLSGTPGYMSPELLQAMASDEFKIQLNFAQDVWSLGVLLYYMCEQDYPFQGTYHQIQNQIAEQEIKQINNQYSIFLFGLIQQFLQHQPQNRIKIQKAIDDIEFLLQMILKDENNYLIQSKLLQEYQIQAIDQFRQQQQPQQQNEEIKQYDQNLKDVYNRQNSRSFAEKLVLKFKNEDELYKKISKIGQGSFGFVNKVQRLNDKQKLFAMKCINVQCITDEQVKEISNIQKLNNKHIIKMKDAFISKNKIQESEQLVIILELADQNLKEKIQDEKQLSEKYILEIFLQILRGIKHMHKQGMYHRDIKVQNILLIGDIAKISDFGISKQQMNTNTMNTIAGTPDYMSPELVDALIKVGENDDSFHLKYNEYYDIWSLGIVLYEMCTNQTPFQAQKNSILVKMKNQEYKDIPEKYSDFLRQLIKDFLQYVPEKRIKIKDAIKKIDAHIGH